MQRVNRRRVVLGLAAATAPLMMGLTSAGAVSPDDAGGRRTIPEPGDGVTSSVLLVARRGRVLRREAFGLANREWSTPMRPDAEFRVGSITKQFTAVAILQLAESRKLSLDDAVTAHIASAPAEWRQITLRHLLTHTSGIPNFTEVPGWEQWLDRDADEVIEFVGKLPLQFAPGSQFAYDNTGYVILGDIVQKTAGLPLDAYLRAHVFDPLGMRYTGFVSDTVLPLRAFGYRRQGSAWADTPWQSNIHNSGAGGLYSNVDDLLAWDRGLHDGKLISAALMRQMFTDYGHGYGFGYSIASSDGRSVWEHNGHVAGFSAMLCHYPEQDLTVIVLSNDDAAPVETLAHKLAASYL